MRSVRASRGGRRDRGAGSGARPGTLAAGAVAVAVLVGGGAVALFGGGSQVPGAGGRPTAPTVAPADTPDGAADGEQSSALPALSELVAVPAGRDALLLDAPQVRWELVGGVAVPFSRTAGPSRLDGPVASGFARSPQGALVAAVQINVRYLLTPGEGWRQVVARQVLPGTGREVYLRARATVDRSAPAGTYGQVAGFRVVTYTDDVAVLLVVSRFPGTGTLQASTITMLWTGGDWAMQLLPDGSTAPAVQRLDSLDGFVVWGI